MRPWLPSINAIYLKTKLIGILSKIWSLQIAFRHLFLYMFLHTNKFGNPEPSPSENDNMPYFEYIKSSSPR